jgi:hypothetical protein
MAGSGLGGFDADAFRSGIRTAMTMGAPPDAGQRATFYFPDETVWDKPVGPDGLPYDPSARPTRTTRTPVSVPCAVTFHATTAHVEDIGYLTPARAAITLLDEDYAQVEGCAGVILRGERFRYSSTDYPTGLFSVAVYTLHFVSEDAP